MPTIQDEKHPAGDDTSLHPDSRLGCHGVRRRWLSLWPPKPLNGFWRWFSLRHLLLLSRPGHTHLVASDNLHIYQSTVDSPQPCFMSSPLMSRCVLDDEELAMLPHRDSVVGRPFVETRKGSGSCNPFSTFRCHIPRQMRIPFWEESDPDLEELLAEDEVDSYGHPDSYNFMDFNF